MAHIKNYMRTYEKLYAYLQKIRCVREKNYMRTCKRKTLIFKDTVAYEPFLNAYKQLSREQKKGCNTQ